LLFEDKKLYTKHPAKLGSKQVREEVGFKYQEILEYFKKRGILRGFAYEIIPC